MTIALQVKGHDAQNLQKAVGFYGLDVYSIGASTQVCRPWVSRAAGARG